MDKALRGALAIGAAIALGIGGAGSLAYWQGSADVQAADFTMGTLAVESNDDGAWTLDSVVIDPATALLVPGDVVTYTETFEITAAGSGLLVTAEIVDADVTRTGDWSHGPSHSVWLEGPADVIEYIRNGQYEVKGSGTITVMATLGIPEDETGGMSAAVDILNGTVLIRQVPVLPTRPSCAC